jgi:hypothetical protein
MRFPFVLVTTAIVLAGHGYCSARETVRTYSVYQCRYSLPDKDWMWADSKSLPNATCVARNTDGLVFVLSVVPVPSGTVMDAKFADGFDESTSAASPMKKRGGRMTTFKGLPCYESDWLVESKYTAVVRVVIANGFAYQLQLLGNADPVQTRPDFEAVMNGFEFTSPPVPPVAPDPLEPGKKLARRMGEVAVYCLFGALALGFLTRGLRKK